jgi:hypothetical protein
LSRQKFTFDWIQKRLFLLLSEDTKEKDIFGRQFVSLYFRQAIINTVDQVRLKYRRSLIKFDTEVEPGVRTKRLSRSTKKL